jgi:hypothetical protein
MGFSSTLNAGNNPVPNNMNVNNNFNNNNNNNNNLWK